MSAKIGLIGLGAMGLPMGRRLLNRGFELVIASHRNRVPSEELVKLGAYVASNPAEVAGMCWLVITSVPDAPQVADVLFGEHGLSSSASADFLHVDMSTI